MKLLELEFLDNTLLDWSLALIAFLATFTVLPLLKGYVGARRRKWREAGTGIPTALDLLTLLISRTSRLFLWAAAAFIASLFLRMPAQAHRVFEGVIVIACWLQVGLWTIAAVRFWLEKRAQRGGGVDAVAAGSLTIIMFVANLIVWAIVVLLALSNLGVNITALVAGLGIGGIAIALAVQTVLGDLLASLAIAFDKPFRIGDTLGIDDYTGAVEDIGIKSTRLRSVSGEQLIISNADILKSRVRNLGRMSEQRALVTLTIDYETPAEKLDTLRSLVEAAVKEQPAARFQYCVLRNFGPTALEVEISYFVRQPQGLDYLHTVDKVNRRIYKELAEHEIRFMHPVRAAYQPSPAERAALKQS